MIDDPRLDLRRRRDEALRALDSERREGRRRRTIERRLAAARERAQARPEEPLAPPFTTFAAASARFETADAAAQHTVADAMTRELVLVESRREIESLEEILRSLPPAASTVSAAAERFDALSPSEREAEEARSETWRALLAARGDALVLADAIRFAERAEWQIARCRDCLAPVKIDFLFDLRGGGFHRDLAKSGRLDAAREYLAGARAALFRAEVAAASVSGAAFPLDDAAFELDAFWIALFRDFARDGYVTSATGTLREMVDRLQRNVSPLRTRAREAERDARALEAELTAREKSGH